MTKIKKPFASRIINQPKLSEIFCWISPNNLSASLRFNSVATMKADIRNKEKRKRLGAIFLNI
jgi:hypothetical protein